MITYELEQEKVFVKKLLKLFENDFSSHYEEIKTDIYFLEKYRIKELFLRLLSKFNPVFHLPYNKQVFFNYLDDWNNNNPGKTIEKDELVNKYYFIQSNNFGIINPYLLRKHIPANNILQFFDSINKQILHYPLFYGTHIDDAIREMNYDSSIGFKDIIGDSEDLFEAIFHNHKGMRKLFKETLTEHLICINYFDWENNIDKYYLLLVTLHSLEINLTVVIDSLGLFKKELLKKHAINILSNKPEILQFEKLNLIRRLLYAPNEIDGIDI